jgi:hypothetical protein
MSSEAARRERPEVLIYGCYEGESKYVDPVILSTVYHLDILRMKIVVIQCEIFSDSF